MNAKPARKRRASPDRTAVVSDVASDPSGAGASPASEELTALERAHVLGFMRAAVWARRSDLIADVYSPAYRADRRDDLAKIDDQATAATDNDADLQPVEAPEGWHEKLDWAARTLRAVADRGRQGLGDSYPEVVSVWGAIRSMAAASEQAASPAAQSARLERALTSQADQEERVIEAFLDAGLVYREGEGVCIGVKEDVDILDKVKAIARNLDRPQYAVQSAASRHEAKTFEEKRARTLLVHLWRSYDAAGTSMGRSHEAVVLEAALTLLGNPDPDDVAWLDKDSGEFVDATRTYLSTKFAALLKGVPQPAVPTEESSEIGRLRALVATCRAGLLEPGATHDRWEHTLDAAAKGEPFDLRGLLPVKPPVKKLSAKRRAAK